MKNRESLYPGRIKLTPVDAANGIYDLVRADEPRDEGTPLNKALLDYAVAACGVTAGTATALTLDDAFGGFTLVDGAKVNFRLHVEPKEGVTLNVNGTGAKALVSARGAKLSLSLPAGAWIIASYNAKLDSYQVMSSMGGWQTLSITTIDVDSKSISVELPTGYNRYRVSVLGLKTAPSGYSDTVAMTFPQKFKGIQRVGINFNGTAKIDEYLYTDDTVIDDIAPLLSYSTSYHFSNRCVFEFYIEGDHTYFSGESMTEYWHYNYFGEMEYAVSSFTLDIGSSTRGPIGAGTIIKIEGDIE